MACESSLITSNQLESIKNTMLKVTKSKIKIYLRTFPDKPIIMKTRQTRMGSGKKIPNNWAAIIKTGKILYEMDGVSESIAKKVYLIASKKISIKTKFIKI
uniref:ribosomal protein L16 n=1 Tax=Thonningia sanguinea TaxID=1618145 RepID=UPI0026E253FA|nr:ribosomal protein L16 [Thonningia sanguinea]WJE89134.1 ribosomal protein L16 [Thonningia sanguinea]